MKWRFLVNAFLWRVKYLNFWGEWKLFFIFYQDKIVNKKDEVNAFKIRNNRKNRMG